ncbi:virulence RhuM family protein [Rhodopirellula sp. JC740]|uniref:Virulence RhuM family protein n=1 Tax=Rhodopirellula halodulae TaxID=2894198 RepID=A0ABS8NDN2_9BACT|nr:virulence RhuM family protein [Rhodopirellula sp. JC740]MCC9641670.1 virulence RhuM family protein [Rhodopirellula sp. JC740]
MTNNLPAPAADDGGEFLLYQTDDGSTRIEVRMAADTVWLTQKDMAELFQTTPQNITQHLASIYEEGELTESATCKEYLQVRSEGKRQVERSLKHYNLDVIISIGYRVRSHRGTQFRIWATQRLREYLIKGFAMDDQRLKQAGGGNYFEELLARIRDIRSSERVFWRKVLDIYSTSIDYDPSDETSLLFFKTVQNKMHWAAHGQTAAEVVHARADASLPNMGLTAFDGDRPRKADVSIAKNYLKEEEIEALNRIVTAYLEFAELQAMNRKPMHMADWISKLDDFLRLSDREILTHAGKISHDSAKEKAEAEFAQFKEQQRNLPQPVDQHFAESLHELKKIEGEAKEAQKKTTTKKKAASKKKPSKKSPRKKKGKDEE